MTKPPINLIYLKYFCDAVRLESVSKSARENFVSQSAISQGIQKLEVMLGKELLVHGANFFCPTKAGQKVFEHAQEIFFAARHLEDALIEDEKEMSGSIDFACTHSFALALLPEFLRVVQKKWPKLVVNVHIAQPHAIQEQVKRGGVDFGIVLDKGDFSSFSCIELYKGQYQLYYSSKHKITEESQFLVSEEPLEVLHLKKAHKKQKKKELPILMEIPSWEVIANFTEEGLGIGFFPDYLAVRARKKLKQYPLSMAPIQYKILAIMPKMRSMPRTIVAFLSLFAQMMQKPSCG